MANLRTLQLLRNSTLYENLEAAITGLKNKANNLLDGSPVVGRYKAVTGSTPQNYEIRTILGVVQETGNTKSISFFNNTEEIDNVLDNLNYTGITSDDSVVLTNVYEADGIISATSKNVGSLKLGGYSKGSDSDSITSADTINSAFSKLENQVDSSLDSLNYKLSKDDNKVVVSFEQKNGLMSGESANISSVKLNGYSEASSVSDIASTDTLGQALGKIQKAVHEMKKDASAVDGEVVTTVSETNGVVSETKANVKDLKLKDYHRTDDAGEITTDDTIEVAFSRLENKVISGQSATTIYAANKSVKVDYKASGTTIGVNVRNGEKVIALDDNQTTGGLYTNIYISSATAQELESLGVNVKEAYKLVATDGSKLGEYIKIYKDSSLVNFYLGHVDDLLQGTTAQTEESTSSTVVPGTGDTALVWIMQLADGKYKLASVNVESFLQEAEFASGVTADSTTHIVHGVVDPQSEKVITSYNSDGTTAGTGNVLTVGTNGFMIGNVQTAINAKIGTLDSTASGKSTHVTVKVDETDGKITAVTVSETDIASKSNLDELSGKTISEVKSTNDSVSAVTSNASDGTKSVNLVTDASKVKMSGFTSSSVLSGISQGDSIVNAFKKVEGVISGGNTSVTTISGKVDTVSGKVDTISGKTITTIKSSNNSITTAVTTSQDSTKAIDIKTEADLISGLTAVADVIGEISGVTESSSVKTAIANLYSSLKAEIAARKSAISGSVISGSPSIDVVEAAQGDGSIVSVHLDTTTNGTGNENTGTNALTITSDGLFLSTNWECGTYD